MISLFLDPGSPCSTEKPKGLIPDKLGSTCGGIEPVECPATRGARPPPPQFPLRIPGSQTAAAFPAAPVSWDSEKNGAVERVSVAVNGWLPEYGGVRVVLNSPWRHSGTIRVLGTSGGPLIVSQCPLCILRVMLDRRGPSQYFPAAEVGANTMTHHLTRHTLPQSGVPRFTTLRINTEPTRQVQAAAAMIRSALAQVIDRDQAPNYLPQNPPLSR